MNEDFLNIATAPGDLPPRDIVARHTLLNQQFRHDNIIQPLAPQPGQPVLVTATSGAQIPLARAELWVTTDGSFPERNATAIPLHPVSTDWRFLAGFVTQWQGAIPGQAAGTIVRYRIAGWLANTPDDAEPDVMAMDGSGFWFRAAPPDNITTYAYPVTASSAVHPQWLQDAVIYQIFLDRFHPGTADGRFPTGLDPLVKHGGTLRGTEMALPYLADLGVTCLWLSPIGISDTYHRYDARDYFTVDPVLGSEDDLRSLTDAAHARGMRVLLDFVPSHLSSDHPAFQAAQTDPDAPTRDWFTFYVWPHSYRSFLDMVPQLVSLNTNSVAGRQHIIDSAVYWVRECGIDGYRLDHVIGHGMDFWTQFQTALTAVKLDAVTIGEATDTPDCLRAYRGRINDVLDFPLARALRLAFGTGDWSVADLDTYLDAYDRFMHDGPGRVSFLDNHDMDRFSYVAGNDTARLKLAALCQFALEQPPVVYYGTETGLPQARGMNEGGFGGDVEVRQDMVWDSAEWDADLLAFYRALIAARHAYPAVRAGERSLVHLDDATGAYAFRRSGGGAGQTIIAAFNLGQSAQSISLPVADYGLALATDKGVTVGNNTVSLPPMTGAWLAVA